MNLETLVLPLKTEDNAFRAGLSRSVQLVQGAVQAIETVIKSTFKWADELDSIGDKMDTTNAHAAAYNYILRKSGTATDTFTKGMVILGKGLVDASGKLDTTGKSLKEWGIDVFDANKQLKDQDTLVAEVADKYATFGTQQERVNFLTEVFGKSGAELVDFFDTLAAEGGIDAVTKKVEQLGLAIDPGRYEQFNRNLEELKLIGLGLAVGFTEQVMPALERLTDWAMNVGVPAFMEFKDGLIDAFQSGGISEALAFIDQEVATFLENIDWSGYGTQFGDLIEGALTNASGEIDVPASLDSLAQGLQEFFISAVGEENLAAFREHFVDYILLQLGVLSTNAQTTTKGMMDQLAIIYGDGQSRINGMFGSFVGSNLVVMGGWGVQLNARFSNTMTILEANIATKLAAISENFQRRASSWLTKAVEVFNNGKGALVTAVSGLVAEINAELRKIIQSVTLSIKAVVFGGSGGAGTPIGTATTAGGGGTTGGGGGSTGGHDTPRASGGPVIAGQPYNVAEFFRPERFVPAVNGRIESLGGQSLQAVTIMNWGDLDYSRLATEIVKAQINT